MKHHRKTGRTSRARRQARTIKSTSRRKLSLELLELRHLLSASPLGYGGEELPKQDEHDDTHPAMDEIYLPPARHLFDSDGFLTDSNSGNPLDIALEYLSTHISSVGLEPGDLSSYEVSSQYVSEHTGVTHIYLSQTFNDLEILGADINVNISPQGEVINVGSSFIAGLDSSGSLLADEPTLGPGEALAALADIFNWSLDAAPAALGTGDGNSQITMLPPSGVSLEEIPAELVYVPVEGGGVELAWRMLVQTLDNNHAYDASVSAADGDLVYLSDWIDGASYNVLPLPVEQPGDGTRATVVDPQDATASPYGWHDTNGVSGAEYTVTRGNNVHAYADRNNDGAADTGSDPSGGSVLTFDFPLDLTLAPINYTSAAVTNLFYWNNVSHDVFYQYGFNEASGSFQVNNYGRGGLGSDDVRAEAQDGGGTNNANFFTPPDGQRPRMQMYEFSRTTPRRDGDLDNMIIVHEYGHGVSNRLVGGPSNVNALDAVQSGGMGEGWSDWFGLMFTQKDSDAKTDAYPVGTYVQGQPASGAGIRRVPYSFNMSVDPLTYGDFNSSREVHDSGEIWCSALWDLTWLLIDDYGFDPDLYNGDGGNNLAMQLVMDAMKLMPTNPSFLDGRDAILVADQVLTGGANNLAIWTAFARRGMGFSAFDGGSGSATTVVEAFDLPTTRAGVVQFDADGYKVGDTVTVTLGDLDLAGLGSVSLTLTASGGDSETILLEESTTVAGYFIGSIATTGTPRGISNEVLEVAAGESLSVIYLDANNGTGASAVASDTAEILNIVSIYSADMNTNPGWSYTGQWAWGTPLGAGGDPSSGHTGANVVGYNLSGSYPNGIGTTYYATTQAIDCTDYENVKLSFHRWLGLESASFDHANIQVSTDGTTWQNVWQHVGGSFQETSWSELEYDISSFADGQSTVYIRWGLGPTDGSVVGSGWNIDDVIVSGTPLGPPTTGDISGAKWNDRDGDGTRDAGEPGLPGWVIFLDEFNDGNVVNAGNVEPDNYDVGTLLNSIHPDATFAAVGSSSPDVYAGNPAGNFASTGTVGFTRNGPFGWGTLTRLRIDFSNPVDFVSLDAISDDAGDIGLLQAYDAEDNLLASYTTASLPAGGIETMSILRTTADVAYVVAHGTAGDIINLDNLHFSQTDRSTITDALGNYQFVDLEPGDYRVREVMDPRWVQTYPGAGTERDIITVAAGDDISGIDFGNQGLPGSIRGQKWNDLNGNGVKDEGEPGLAGWTIFIDADRDGALDAGETSTVTDGSGDYFFPDLVPNDYQIGEVLQLGWRQTHPAPIDVSGLIVNGGFETGSFSSWNQQNVGNGNFVINNGTFVPASSYVPSPVFAGSYSAISNQTGPGTHVLYQDVTIPTGTHVILNWHDQIRNHAGTFVDPSQEYRVEIRNTANEVLATVFSTNPGDVALQEWTARSADLSAFSGQTIRIAFVEQDNIGFFNVQLDEIHVEDSGAPRTITVTVGADEDVVGADIGNQIAPGTIQGQKWNDVDGDGSKDPGEPGLAGWTIYLDVDNDSVLDPDELSVVTGADGSYEFTEVPIGTYTVREVVRPGWVQTFPTDDGVTTVAVFDDSLFVDSDNTSGSESDTVQATLASFGINVTTFAGTTEATWATALADADVLVIPELERQSLAPALSAGAVAVLQDFVEAGGGLIINGSSSARSAALLNLVFGFTVSESSASGRSTYSRTVAAAGTEFADDALTLPLPSATRALTRSLLPAGSSSIYDDSSQSIVSLMPVGGGKVIYLGWDWFEAAPLGTQDGGWVQAMESAVLEIGTSATVAGGHRVTVDPGEVISGLDFGNQPLPGSISGQKWHDLDQDGSKDPEEPVLAGWTIFLDTDNDSVLDPDETSTVTAADGTYSFSGVAHGDYIVREVLQPGWTQTFPVTDATPRVVVFDDSSFVDTAGSTSAESDNVQATLASLGFTVTTFVGTSASDWSAALADVDAILIPELEVGSLSTSITPGAVEALRDFVNAGGGLIINGSHTRNRAALLLNLVFGFNLTEFETNQSSYSRTTAVAGTEFADDTLTLPRNNGTNYLATASLPTGALSLYEASSQTVVALVPQGSGEVVYLGFDWYNAAPRGSQDGGWVQSLQSAVLEVATSTLPGAHLVTVDPGQEVANIDFGNYREPVTTSADFDGDGDVDGRDFLAWQRGYGSSSALRSDGDADGDGLVGSSDLAQWQDSYGQTSELTGFVAIDEEEPALESAASQGFWTTSLVSPEIESSTRDTAVDDARQLELVDDAFSQLSEPTSWQASDFGDIAVCRDVDEELEFESEFDELLLAAFGE